MIDLADSGERAVSVPNYDGEGVTVTVNSVFRLINSGI